MSSSVLGIEIMSTSFYNLNFYIFEEQITWDKWAQTSARHTGSTQWSFGDDLIIGDGGQPNGKSEPLRG